MDLPSIRRGRSAAALGCVSAALAGCVTLPPPQYEPVPARSIAQPVYFYPERRQDEARQDRDRYECYRWAVRESGVDPGMTPVRSAPVPPPRAAVRDGAEVVAGAATGAIVGAAVSSPHHAGEGAVIGAIFGSLLGAAAQESRVQAAEYAYARRQSYAQVPLDNFRRAMGACMSGRGYRVG
jgi:hypothetical protein